MAKIPFQNANGRRDSKRALKNGLSSKVTGQIRALNGASVFDLKKVTNSADQGNPDLREPLKTETPPFATPVTDVTLDAAKSTEAAIAAASGGTVPAPTPTPAPENPKTATPAVCCNSAVFPHCRGNYQSALSAMRTKLVNAADMEDDEEEDEEVPAKA